MVLLKILSLVALTSLVYANYEFHSIDLSSWKLVLTQSQVTLVAVNGNPTANVTLNLDMYLNQSGSVDKQAVSELIEDRISTFTEDQLIPVSGHRGDDNQQKKPVNYFFKMVDYMTFGPKPSPSVAVAMNVTVWAEKHYHSQELISMIKAMRPTL